MKKIFFTIVLIFLIAWLAAPVSAEENSVDAKIDVNLGNFSYEESNGNPHAQPGPSGGALIQVYNIPEDGKHGWAYVLNPSIDGLTLEEMARLGENISNYRIKKDYVLGKLPDEYQEAPVRVLKATPVNLKLLAGFSIRSYKDESIKPLIGKLLLAAKLTTNARFAVVKIRFKKKPEVKGIALGNGLASNLNSENSAASVGAILGWSTAENYTITLIQVEAYGGRKDLPPLPTIDAGKTLKPITNAKDAGKVKNAKKVKSMYEDFTAQPIFFDFNADTPQAGQEEKIRAWAIWLAKNFDNLAEVEFRGHCDTRGKEDYNGGLGIRRSSNVMYPIIDLLVNIGKTPEQQKKIRAACKQKFRATSTGEHEPDFSGKSEKIHQKNRRVDLVIVHKNLTLSNLKKKENK